MALYDYTLTDVELETLDDLARKIYDFKELRDCVRPFLKNYLAGLDIKLKSFELSRLMSKPSAASKYRYTAAIYDFLSKEMPGALGKYIGLSPEDVQNLRHELEDLIALRGKALAGSRSALVEFDQLSNIDGHLADIPNNLYREYFGYRRGSDAGEIIRFHIDLRRTTGNPQKTWFVNEYMSKGLHWIVEGFGFYMRETLYLCGHALSASDHDVKAVQDRDSLGLRFFALKPLNIGGCLGGPILSMDHNGMPISARVLLVPIASHAAYMNNGNASPPKKMSREAIKPWIERSPDLEEDIKGQIGNLFGPQSAYKFLELIRNTSLTVVGSDSAIDSQTILQEEKIRDLCMLNDYDMNQTVVSIYRKALDEYIDRIEKGHPG